jgi:hypothetical protein
MDFLDKLKELFGDFSPEALAKIEAGEKEIVESYKMYGFDSKKPPTDVELAAWAMKMIQNWYTEPDLKMNLPLTALCLAYNITTLYKLDVPEQINLKTLLVAVFNMGYNMGKYKLKSPFDPRPRPQDLN